MDVLSFLGPASDGRACRKANPDETALVVTGFAALGGVAVVD